MSIATERGDAGKTSLPGGARVSKSDPRVEAYGTVDELISALGLARAFCANAEIREWTKSIQRELFKVGSALGAPPKGEGAPVNVDDVMVDRLTAEIHRIEAMPGIFADWSLPGEDVASAAFDMARAICRRAERLAVGLKDAGEPVEANALRYLNRLSDLLWLFARVIEIEQGIDSKLRGPEGGSRWSRAW
jgi:cob(I)alamin adenosyltransferase